MLCCHSVLYVHCLQRVRRMVTPSSRDTKQPRQVADSRSRGPLSLAVDDSRIALRRLVTVAPNAAIARQTRSNACSPTEA